LSPATVEATIAILRDQERYESASWCPHPGSALVAAATLRIVYITDRFLPDKAIDLVDEAGSRLRMELDSMPTEIESTRAPIHSSKSNKAPSKRKRRSSRERLKRLEKDLAISKKIQPAQSSVANERPPSTPSAYQQPNRTGKLELNSQRRNDLNLAAQSIRKFAELQAKTRRCRKSLARKARQPAVAHEESRGGHRRVVASGLAFPFQR